MYEYIKGEIKELNPSYAILEANGIGFFINISLQTYSKVTDNSSSRECLLYINQIIREDAHLLFGFFTQHEREIFRQLISVSGVGANTARMILSSLTTEEIQHAIGNANVNVLKSIKGIGAKTAERIIVDLKDKIGMGSGNIDQMFLSQQNNSKGEALAALTTLGFAKNSSEKVLEKIVSEKKNISVEELVKEALKRM